MVQTRRQQKNLKKGSRQQRGRNKKKTLRQTRRRNDKRRQNKGARKGRQSRQRGGGLKIKKEYLNKVYGEYKSGTHAYGDNKLPYNDTVQPSERKPLMPLLADAQYQTARKRLNIFKEKRNLCTKLPECENMLEEGLHNKQSEPCYYENAIKWLKQAADMDHTSAQIYLGDLYKKGVGVEMNLDRAIEWYKKASEKKTVAPWKLKKNKYWYRNWEKHILATKIAPKTVDQNNALQKLQELQNSGPSSEAIDVPATSVKDLDDLVSIARENNEY